MVSQVAADSVLIHRLVLPLLSSLWCFLVILYSTFVTMALFTVSPVLNKNQSEQGCGIEVIFFFLSGSFQLSFEIHSHTAIRNEDLMILPACLPSPLPLLS